jgi:2-oxoisovalerate dehydrogenase E1 component alpha subunit
VFGFYELISELAENARNGKGPALVEAKMYRITPHSSDDDDRTYRSREEVEEHKKSDPILRTQQKLLDEGIYTEKDLEELDKKAKEMVTEAVKYAEEAPYPSGEEAAYPVYVEEVPNA